MDKPAVIVSGLGRCGSSLAMQMLQAAGVPCVGDYPAFEHPESNPRNLSDAWFRSQGGRAFKLLDPHLAEIALNKQPAIVIFLRRDVEQQAASMVKFGAALMGLPKSRKYRRGLAASFIRDLPRARARFSGLRMLALSFETMVLAPFDTACLMAAFLMAEGFEFNVEAARGAVRLRTPDCYPGLLEAELVT